ncbi:MAG: DUF1963 domain-containing protein [Hyphomicrobiaceae bacterium]
MRDIYKWLYGKRGRAALGAPAPLVPDVLQPFVAAINRTMLPVMGAGFDHDAAAVATGSRLGGRPWWPKGDPYPLDQDGKPLYLLIQINFDEMPRFSPFPETGLLQLFIGGDPLFGANLDDPTRPAGFRAIYHSSLDRPHEAKAGVRSVAKSAHLPLEHPLNPIGLAFEADQMPVDPSDYRFAQLLPEIAGDEDLVEAYADWLVSDLAPSAIRLGGYPTFTQDDPRGSMPNGSLGDLALLTLDSTNGLMWGDAGAAQFLMHEQDLLRRDFSKVVYNWDCY